MSKSEVNQEIQARTPSTCGSRRPSLTPLGAQGAQGQGAAGLAGPAGGHGSSTLQRRLSEIVLEPLRSSVSVGSAFGSTFGSAIGSASPRGAKFHKVASDLVWRPRHWLLGRSLNSIEQHALSWHQSSNTLQVQAAVRPPKLEEKFGEKTKILLFPSDLCNFFCVLFFFYFVFLYF